MTAITVINEWKYCVKSDIYLPCFPPLSSNGTQTDGTEMHQTVRTFTIAFKNG